jgi:hypothetical protein
MDASPSPALDARVVQPDRTQDSGRGWSENRLDVEHFRDRAGVLASGPTEGEERILPRVVAATQGDLPDRFGHTLVRNAQPALQEFLGLDDLSGLFA